MKIKEFPTWLKNRGYLHITQQINVYDNPQRLLSKIYNSNYVAKYAFFPLIHASIDERRYKRNPFNKHCHSYKDKNGVTQRHIKKRPLHYATHMDALIFGYYAELLQTKYEKELLRNEEFSKCILAYRKIKISEEKDSKCKSTIHFADEVFSEIQRRSQNEDCIVLTFDIKSFFSSLNHHLLKKAWAKLIQKDKLPDDHYNVFKAATRFSYILLDDLRLTQKNRGRKAGFDEKKLAKIRNEKGFNAFFESPEDFRNQLKDRKIKLHRFPFRDKKDKKPMGIPQGLPISAVLANLYLLEFDKLVFERVTDLGGFYRRYSDDMIVICNQENANKLKVFVESEIENSLVEISRDKTETFLFKSIKLGKKEKRLTSIKITEDRCIIEAPFTYLGFEFYGSKTLIKSANLAKFYRRMISTVKRKSKLAIKIAEREGKEKPVLYKRRLYKLYMNSNLNKVKVHLRRKIFTQNNLGEYRIKSSKSEKSFRSNYLSYIKRASKIMDEDAILKQIGNKHKGIFNQALKRHLRKI